MKYDAITPEEEKLATIRWTCRSHPTDWFHEVGCPHVKWTAEQLQNALNTQKKLNTIYAHKLYGTPL